MRTVQVGFNQILRTCISRRSEPGKARIKESVMLQLYFFLIFQKGHDFYEGVRAGKHAHLKCFPNLITHRLTVVLHL